MTRFLLAVAAAAACAPAASAQCSIYRPNIPDFDQLRATTCGGGIAGLPNHGQMYCVPTSTVNLMAYLANNGYPGLMGAAGNWQNANYNFVNFRIGQMGAAMTTNPTGGTGLAGWYYGTRNWLRAGAPNKFNLSGRASWRGYAPSPLEMHNAMRAGGLVTFAFGYYQFVPQVNAYVRTGGHCVTLVGVTNACGANPVLRIHDPATDMQNWCAQSGFQVFDAATTPVLANFREAINRPSVARTQWQLTNYQAGGAVCFLDAYLTIWPKVALAARPQNGLLPGDALRVFRPAVVAGDPFDVVTDYPTPGGAQIVDVDLFPGLDVYIVSTSQQGAQPATLWAFNPHGGTYTGIATLSDPGPMTFSRFGQLFISNAGMVQEADILTQPATIVAQRAPAHPISSIASSDFTGELLALSVPDGVITVYDLPLGDNSPVTDLALPPGAVLAGTGSLAINHSDGSLWVTSTGSGAIYKLAVSAGALVLAETVTHETIASPIGLQVGDTGHLFFSSDGTLRELMYDAKAGEWVEAPDSDLGGREGSVALAISLDRENIPDDFPMDTDINILPDDNPGAEPCAADFNLDGELNSADFFDFLACFFGAGCPRFQTADFNADAETNSQDFFDFLNAFFAGCA